MNENVEGKAREAMETAAAAACTLNEATATDVVCSWVKQRAIEEV